jgi:Xaa-Pro dipeptidase
MSATEFHQSVPTSEIEQRIASFQGLLAQAEIAAAVVVQSADLYYLTGTTQNAHLVVPSAGEPVMLVRRTLERAQAESPVRRVEQLSSLSELAGVLAGAGLGDGRLGFELDVLPAARYLDYARRLPNHQLVDCSDLIRSIRAVKSPWELERVREAAAMISGVDERMREVFRLGMSEVELAAEIEFWLRSMGHQGQLRMRAFNGDLHYGTITAGPAGALPGGTDTPLVGAGLNPYIGKGASASSIDSGMPIVIDLIGSSEGYIADQTRCFSAGSLPQRMVEAYERSVEIGAEVSAAARPGVLGSALYKLALEIADDLAPAMATGTRVSFVAHGIGLELDEPPFFARGWDRPLEAGMVFALEPKFVFPGEGALGLENSYVVTANGAEKLTSAPEELIAL